MSSKAAQARHDAAVLPRIRDLEAAGLSLREIADQLQADGLPPPRRGGRWSATAVKRILGRAQPLQPDPAQATVSVNGAVNMTGPLTIFTAGPVTTTGPVTITTAEPTPEPTPKDSAIIELVGPVTPHLPSHLSSVAFPPVPFFFRRRT